MHGSVVVEVLTQFTEPRLMRSAAFDGQGCGLWWFESTVGRLPLLIDYRSVPVAFGGE